jgi:hypothetical protein
VHFLHIANSDKPVAFYSLDVILVVGYRTNSPGATKSLFGEYLVLLSRLLHEIRIFCPFIYSCAIIYTCVLYRNIMSSVAEFEETFIRAQHDAIISDILFRKCNEQNDKCCQPFITIYILFQNLLTFFKLLYIMLWSVIWK